MAATWLPFQKNLSCGLKLRGEEGVFHRVAGGGFDSVGSPSLQGLAATTGTAGEKTEQPHAVYK